MILLVTHLYVLVHENVAHHNNFIKRTLVSRLCFTVWDVLIKSFVLLRILNGWLKHYSLSYENCFS